MEQSNKEKHELINKLASGEIKSEDFHVNHSIGKLREKGAESISIKNQYEQASNAAERFRVRLLEVNAECNSHEDDVIVFYNKSMEKETVPTVGKSK